MIITTNLKDKKKLILIGRCIDLFRDKTCITPSAEILEMIRDNLNDD